jgi:hypothetical protein
MYLTAAYEITGLSPTITIYNLKDDSVVINAASMTEIDSSGVYKYNFSAYSTGEDYAYRADAGSGQGDNRYRYGTKLNIDQWVVAPYETIELSPTVDIYDLSDNSVSVNDGAMSEISTTGIYKYKFSGAEESKNYLYIADAGAGEGDNRYKYGTSTLGLTGTITSRLTALRAGIYTLGKTVSGLDATNLYYGKAKQDQNSPYCVFFGVGNPTTLDSGDEIEKDRIQFDFYGTNLTTLETLVASHKAVFNRSVSLSIANYILIDCRLIFERQPLWEEEYWRISHDYLMQTTKAR